MAYALLLLRGYSYKPASIRKLRDLPLEHNSFSEIRGICISPRNHEFPLSTLRVYQQQCHSKKKILLGRRQLLGKEIFVIYSVLLGEARPDMKPTSVKGTTVSAITKRLSAMAVGRVVDMVFRNYVNDRLRDTAFERVLTECENYRLISIGIILAQNLDTAGMARGMLAIVTNPWYDRFLNFVIGRVA